MREPEIPAVSLPAICIVRYGKDSGVGSHANFSTMPIKEPCLFL
jgi:hypothetical protein